MQVSKNFSLSEFEESPTANRLGIDNAVPEEFINRIELLATKVLQPVRNHLKSSINITSGYRCPTLNKRIGGASTSQHQTAEAADFVCNDNADAFNFIRANCVFDQLIWEFGNDNQPKWVHVSYDSQGKNRGQLLKAAKVNGKTKYIKIA